MEAVNEDEVQMMVYKGMTHKQISAELQIRFPGTRGFSERTVRRFCERHGIHEPRGLKLDQLVEEATQEVSKLKGRPLYLLVEFVNHVFFFYETLCIVQLPLFCQPLQS